MSDFSNLFGFNDREEDSLFGATGGGVSEFESLFAPAQPLEPEGALFDPTITRERNFMDRLLAPFEAPQQGLYQFTVDVAKDGFQFGDILSAFGHGIRYFNPWGNEQRIDEEQIRRIFIGEDSNATRRFLSNTAISLLYDPLLFVGLAKGAKLLTEGTRLTRVVDGLTNPASVVVDGMRLASRRVIAPNVRRAGIAIAGGEAQYEQFAIKFAQMVGSKFSGVPESVRKAADIADQSIHNWREQAYKLVREAEVLGGRKGNQLLAEGLELDGLYARTLAREAGVADDAIPLTKRQRNQLANFDQKLAQAGIDEDLFYQVFSQYRKLDDKIGESLWRAGVINREEYEAFAGTHLRRMYAAWERPAEYIDRIEAMIEAGQTPSGRAITEDMLNDSQRLSRGTLLRNMTRMRSVMDEFAAGKRVYAASGEEAYNNLSDFLVSSAYNRYFSDGRFNPKSFTDDLMDYLDSSAGSSKSLDELLTHVKEDMLGGIEAPEQLWKELTNFVSDAHFTQRGLNSYLDKLRQMTYGNSMAFRTITERMEVVSKRENVPELIREVLGEVLEASPRIASEASDAGKLLAMREFTDTLSGTVRVGDEAADLIKDMNAAMDSGDLNGARAILADIKDVYREQGIDLGDISIGDVAKLDVGSEVRVLGSDVARTAENKRPNDVLVPDDPSYGNLAGMYVDPGTYIFIQRMEGGGTTGNVNRRIWGKIGEFVQRGTGQYKLLKAVLDPVAQFRNFVGNMVLMDLAGVSPFRVDLMIKSGEELRRYAKTGEMGEYLTRAHEAGVNLFQHTFSRQELQDVANAMPADPLTRANWRDGWTRMYEGMERAWRNVRDAGIKTFDFNEKMFKLTVFTDTFDNLRTSALRAGTPLTEDLLRDMAVQAGAKADQALFNYADVPYLVDFARKYGVVPFITFPFKAVPFIAETLYARPWRVLKYERIAQEVNEYRAGGPEDVAREVAGLPEHVRDNMVLRLPFEDNRGRPLYVDMSFFMPWYTIQELTEGFRADPTDLGSGGFRDNPLASGPLVDLFNFLVRKEDGFGNPLYTPDMDTGDKFQVFAKRAMDFWLPPSFPGGSRSSSVGRAMQAVARDNPDPIDWLDRLGKFFQANNAQDDIFPRPGFLPQSQGQIGTARDERPGQFATDVVGSALSGLLFGGATASDAPQQGLQASGKLTATANEIARERSRVLQSNLPFEEKRERLLHLNELLMEATGGFATQMRNLFE